MTKIISAGAAVLGLGLAGVPAAHAQEAALTPAASTPTIEPTGTGTPTRTSAPLVALPCVSSPTRGFFSRPQVPMPPELQGDVVLVKTGAIRFSGKPPSLKPFAVKEFKLGAVQGGPGPVDIPFWLRELNPFPGFTLDSLTIQQNFSFVLVREDAPAVPRVAVRCGWGLASISGGVSGRSGGVEMRVPHGNTTLCELQEEAGTEPWKLFLWVGPPSNLIPPEFPSGGGLVRGEVQYEATSTNTIKPNLLGLNPAMITATFFRKEGRTVTAVERLTPGRVLMDCSVPPAEQSLFVAIGAALFIRDGVAVKYEH